MWKSFFFFCILFYLFVLSLWVICLMNEFKFIWKLIERIREKQCKRVNEYEAPRRRYQYKNRSNKLNLLSSDVEHWIRFWISFLFVKGIRSHAMNCMRAQIEIQLKYFWIVNAHSLQKEKEKEKSAKNKKMTMSSFGFLFVSNDDTKMCHKWIINDQVLRLLHFAFHSLLFKRWNESVIFVSRLLNEIIGVVDIFHFFFLSIFLLVLLVFVLCMRCGKTAIIKNCQLICFRSYSGWHRKFLNTM